MNPDSTVIGSLYNPYTVTTLPELTPVADMLACYGLYHTQGLSDPLNQIEN